jgi:hypothetical protein
MRQLNAKVEKLFGDKKDQSDHRESFGEYSKYYIIPAHLRGT